MVMYDALFHILEEELHVSSVHGYFSEVVVAHQLGEVKTGIKKKKMSGEKIGEQYNWV